MYHARIPQEDPCPVADHVLGDLYRASPEGLATLVETISPNVRAMLAVYCSRRAHLLSIGLAVAATCDKGSLIDFGGDYGADLYERARRAPKPERERRKVSLSQGTLLQLVIDQDLV